MSEVPLSVTAEPPVSHEHLITQETFAALHPRLLLTGDALNPDKVDLPPVTSESLATLEGRDYGVFNGVSRRERKDYWRGKEDDDFDRQRRAWIEQTANVFTNAHKFFQEGDKGKRWSQTLSVTGLDTTQFSAMDQAQAQAEMLFDKYFTSDNKHSNIKQFVTDLVNSSPSLSPDDLEAVQWLSNIFGKTSSEIITQLTDAELKVKIKPQALIDQANQTTAKDGQELSRINNLNQEERRLLGFLWGEGESQTTIPSVDQASQLETTIKKEGRLKAEELLEKGFSPETDPPILILKNQIDRAAEHFRQQGIISPRDLALALSKIFFDVSFYQRIVEQDMFGPKEFERAENIQEANIHIANIRTGLTGLKQAATKHGFGLEPDVPWLHYKSPEYQKKHENTTYRIYLNPNYDYYPAIVQTLIDWGKTNPLYFKIVDALSPYDLRRLDKIVIYLSDDNVDEVLDLVTTQAKAHPEIFQGKAIPGGSGIIIGDGIGLARQDQEKNQATGHRKTGGEINAERVGQATRERLNARVLDALSKYSNEADFLASLEAEYFRKIIVDCKIWPKEISSDQTKSIWAESMLKALYRGRAGITKDKYDKDVLLPHQIQLKELYVEELRRAGNQQAADRIKSMAVPEFEKIFYLQNYITEEQLQRIGFAIELQTLLSQGKKPGEFFKELVFTKPS